VHEGLADDLWNIEMVVVGEELVLRGALIFGLGGCIIVTILGWSITFGRGFVLWREEDSMGDALAWF
jgi:hypothetical protein